MDHGEASFLYRQLEFGIILLILDYINEKVAEEKKALEEEISEVVEKHFHPKPSGRLPGDALAMFPPVLSDILCIILLT